MAIGVLVLWLAPASAADRPNIVWILSEDNSIHYLERYGYGPGGTPHIEQLAAHGITFDHAFSNAPVCSVARTTLMTGILAPRVGFQYHRASKPARLPQGAELFPAYLRQAGYYTTNNAKKDYNVIEGEVWDESSRKATWRNRPDPASPFFHMQTTTLSHESSLHFTDLSGRLTTNPEEIELAPYHPDTEVFRYTYARYFDRMRLIDQQVGKIANQLDEDGLLEDTFIFYFGDHGGVLPRSKGYVYESGLHVPLVVRVPKKWQHLVDRQIGSRAQGFVDFIDFGPTVLRLAGVEVPEVMDGRPFLGEGVSARAVDQRDESFGYADRFDEKYDLCRSLRKGRYHYIRNYQAFYPDSLQNNYRYRMLAYAQWRRRYVEGELNPAQRQFFEARPVEQLFDVEADPHEVHDLSQDPQYADTLEDLRARLQARVKALPDLSFFPESYLIEHALPEGATFGQARRPQIARLVDIADLSLLPFPQAQSGLEAALVSQDPWQRYWGLIACSCFGAEAESLVPRARNLLEDDEPLVRVRAAEFLGRLRQEDPRPTLYAALQTPTNPVEALLSLNTVVYLHDKQNGYQFDASRIQIRGSEIGRRIEYLEQNRASK